MNDRLPGSCYDNPIRYKGYRIYLSDMFRVHGFEFEYVHESYDGAPDARDNRFGQAHTEAEAKAEIDEKEDDNRSP